MFQYSRADHTTPSQCVFVGQSTILYHNSNCSSTLSTLDALLAVACYALRFPVSILGHVSILSAHRVL